MVNALVAKLPAYLIYIYTYASNHQHLGGEEGREKGRKGEREGGGGEGWNGDGWKVRECQYTGGYLVVQFRCHTQEEVHVE